MTRSTRLNCSHSLRLKKMYSPSTELTRNGHIFQYVTQIDFLFSTNLEYESGDHVGTFDEKTRVQNHMQVSLSGLPWLLRNVYCC
jgi:hypothetical protein